VTSEMRELMSRQVRLLEQISAQLRDLPGQLRAEIGTAVPGKPRRKRPKATVTGTPDPALLKTLCAYAAKQRRKVAQIRGYKKPVGYIPLADRDMTEVAIVKPTTPEALQALAGWGAWKVEQFGTDVLAIIGKSAS